MSRHNRRRRRGRQSRHKDLLAEAYALEGIGDDSSSVVSWPSSERSAPLSEKSAQSGFDTLSSTNNGSPVIYTPSSIESAETDSGDGLSGTICRAKVSNGDYSFFWYPTPGQNPWAQQPSPKQPYVSDHLCEYIYARKKTFPPGLGPRIPFWPLPVGPWYKPLQQTILPYEKEEIILPHGDHCDSLCDTMTSVIKSLFQGQMDYNDEEIAEAQAKRKAEQRAQQIAQRQAAAHQKAERRTQPHVLQARQHRISQRTQQRYQQWNQYQARNPSQQALQPSIWAPNGAFKRHYAHVFL